MLLLGLLSKLSLSKVDPEQKSLLRLNDNQPYTMPADKNAAEESEQKEQRAKRKREQSRASYARNSEKRKAARRKRYAAAMEECDICLVPVAKDNLAHKTTARHIMLANRREEQKALVTRAGAVRLLDCSTSCRLCRKLGWTDREKQDENGESEWFDSDDDEGCDEVDEARLIAEGWSHSTIPESFDDGELLRVSDDEYEGESGEL